MFKRGEFCHDVSLGTYPKISKGGGGELQSKTYAVETFGWDKLFCLYQLVQGFVSQPKRFVTFQHLILLFS